MRQNKIITIATLVSLSLSATYSFAFNVNPVPTHYHTKALESVAKEHNRLATANMAFAQQEKASRSAATKSIKTSRNASRDGVDKTRSENITKLIEARATHVKARIKKIDTTARYTTDSRDQDENKIDILKTQFITEQSKK